MSYEVILRKQPVKYLKKLNEKDKKIFRKIFETLEHVPLKITRKLHGELEGLYKVPIGNKRMVIFITAFEKQIKVMEIGPIGDICK